VSEGTDDPATINNVETDCDIADSHCDDDSNMPPKDNDSYSEGLAASHMDHPEVACMTQKNNIK
jgi:hypothetical protein